MCEEFDQKSIKCLLTFRQYLRTWLMSEVLGELLRKQPFKGVLQKSYSENMQQIYRRTSMHKCDFNKDAKWLYWNHTLAWVFPCKFAAYFQNTFFIKTPSEWLLPVTSYYFSVERSHLLLFWNYFRKIS